ncbi:allantoin permease [Salmonella enterica subsp. enterica]|uniref:Allantoin permease n=1 Tax=Salmonella enterica I TaxID=59201 RepID=A0A379VUJ8_SALET|nr:allantoin permease [Salmonella enterica subsp. enterica]
MEHQRELYQQRGYSEDLLPKTETQRNWKAFNYFTLWMGSVHNVPNYVMVGGFFILGYQHLISCWPLLSAHYLLRQRW